MFELTSAIIPTSDVQIGAVELKNAATDDRALISDANTARGVTDHVLSVQHIDAAGAVLTEATQTAIQTALEAMDDWDESNRAAVNLIASQVGVAGGTGADAGNVLRVSLATNVALPAGTNAIGKLAANSGVDIGDVDVLSIAAGDNNIGNVDLVSLPAGNLGQQLSAASLSVTPATDVADATYIGDIKFGESLPAGTNAIGKLAANSGVDIGDVDITSIAAGDNNIGNVDIASIAAGDNNIGNVDVASLPVGTAAMAASTPVTIASDDTLTTAIKTAVEVMDDWDESDRAKVNLIVGQAGVTAGAGAVAANTPRVTLASDDPAVASLGILDDWDNTASDGASVSGDVAHDNADAGEPVKIGGKAKEQDGSDPGSVAEDDRTNAIFDRNGRQFVNIAHPNLFKGRDNQATAQTNKAVKSAPGASLSLYVTDILMSTDTAMNILLVEDTTGTPATIAGPFYFSANGGLAMPLITPIRLTANKDLGYTSSAAGNHTVEIHGYTAP